jgi:hypothetical protein
MARCMSAPPRRVAKEGARQGGRSKGFAGTVWFSWANQVFGVQRSVCRKSRKHGAGRKVLAGKRLQSRMECGASVFGHPRSGWEKALVFCAVVERDCKMRIISPPGQSFFSKRAVGDFPSGLRDSSSTTAFLLHRRGGKALQECRPAGRRCLSRHLFHPADLLGEGCGLGFLKIPEIDELPLDARPIRRNVDSEAESGARRGAGSKESLVLRHFQ